MFFLLVVVLISFGLLLAYYGRRWESTYKPPESTSKPKVSVLIPAYNSEKIIGDTIESIKSSDYPNLEILVVNDSNDGTAQICSEKGVRCIQNTVRKGKSIALNEAVKHTSGEILFFLDADTVVEKDAVSRLVPWFENPKIAAVSPKYTVKNKKNFLTRLISIEHAFISTFFKVHMYFGSILSFRGCGIALRKSTFLQLGGWPKTLIEDTDFSATLVKNGYVIQYEPKAVIQTNEPETFKELSRQRLRWGKGTLFAFIHHYRFYLRNKQFFFYFIPYIILFMATLSFLLFNTYIYLVPLLSVYLLYTFSIKEALFVVVLFFIPLISNLISTLTTATFSHVALITWPEKKKSSDIFYIIPYVAVFIPMIMSCYIRGIISGVRDAKNKKGELNIEKDW